MRLIFFLFFFSLCLSQSYVPYEVDLDSNPLHRYDHIIREYDDPLQEFLTSLRSIFSPWEKFAIYYILGPIYHVLELFINQEFVKELRGIAKALDAPVIELLALNIGYEMMELCTTIVARDLQGNILLARNLDIYYPQHVRRLTVTIKYTKGGREVLTCSGLAGLVGFLTCVRPGVYGVALNARELLSWKDTLISALKGWPTVSWMIRTTLLKAETYDEALKIFLEKPSISGSYIIMAGTKPNEGAVITRGRKNAEDVITLNETAWFLAQANNDRWLPPDERTVKANLWMQELGQANVSLQNIVEKVLMIPPIFREETVAIDLMFPLKGYMFVYRLTLEHHSKGQ